MSTRNSQVRQLMETFPIGTYIRFTHTYQKVYPKDETGRVLNDKPVIHGERPVKPRWRDGAFGIVIGARWKKLGHTEPGYNSGNYFDGDDYCPAQFTAFKGGGKLVLLVRLGYMNKEMEVPPERAEVHWTPFNYNDMEGVSFDRRFDRFPTICGRHTSRDGREQLKAFYDENTEMFPRDSLGRFRKCLPGDFDQGQ